MQITTLGLILENILVDPLMTDRSINLNFKPETNLLGAPVLLE